MQLTKDDIAEFRQIWRDEFNEEITEEQARHEAVLLLELHEVLGATRPSSPTAPPEVTTSAPSS